MTIYCSQCGKDHPDDANFCMKCGAPLGEGVQALWQPEPQWEYCEIVFEELRAGGITRREKIQFWAKAIGLQGEYSAGTGPEVYADQTGWRRITSSGQDQTNYVPALNALIAQLSGQGWEPVPNKGSSWFSYKFRRQVR